MQGQGAHKAPAQCLERLLVAWLSYPSTGKRHAWNIVPHQSPTSGRQSKPPALSNQERKWLDMNIKGNGTIRPIKNKKGEKVKNSWQLVLSLGYDPITGKRIQKCRRFKGTKTEAMRALESFRREIESGLRLDADKVTFREYAQQWVDSREASKRLAPATIKRNKEILSHLNRHLEDLPLTRIDAPTVRNLYIHLTSDGIGETTLAKAAVMLKQILKQSVMDGIILRNPCDMVEAPKQKKSKVGKALDRAGVAKLVTALDELENTEYPLATDAQQKATTNLAHATAIRMILATGLRQGELLALSWKDIDFANRLLSVTHTLDKVTGELKAPKTESGVRDIALDDQILSDLRRWHLAQSRYLNSLGMEQGTSTPVITNEAGQRLDASGLERWWRRFREQKKFGDTFHALRLHDLRHTHATMLVSSGLNIKAVSSRLGHASVGITLDLYSHAQREDDEKAARIMGDLMAREASDC